MALAADDREAGSALTLDGLAWQDFVLHGPQPFVNQIDRAQRRQRNDLLNKLELFVVALLRGLACVNIQSVLVDLHFSKVPK